MGLGLPFADFISLPKESLEESGPEKKTDLLVTNTMTDVFQTAAPEKDHVSPATIRRYWLFISN